MMIFKINIASVDGVSNDSTYQHNRDDALKFIKDYDHEGSAIFMAVELNGEDVYKFLESLKENG
jgi:hypothetical protein